jgi:hypothetical protein
MTKKIKKYCVYCDKEFEQRLGEKNSDFAERRCCFRTCANRLRNAK